MLSVNFDVCKNVHGRLFDLSGFFAVVVFHIGGVCACRGQEIAKGAPEGAGTVNYACVRVNEYLIIMSVRASGVTWVQLTQHHVHYGWDITRVVRSRSVKECRQCQYSSWDHVAISLTGV